jgi:mannose-6-phosphate isomerase-like protein (cupin superfamily)
MPVTIKPTQTITYIEESVHAWKNFLATHYWQHLVANSEPQESINGIIYALPNSLIRDNESIVIIDMRKLHHTEPHYHSAHVTEIYFILQGGGIVVVGNKESSFTAGDVIVTPPLTTHYVIPDDQCVMAVVNLPTFNIEDYHVIAETNEAVKFDKAQFEQLTQTDHKVSQVNI